MCRVRPDGQGGPVIKIESLSKKYGPFTAVDDVSFTARPGRGNGFLGPNVGGRTTPLRTAVGLTPPTSGRATIFGTRFADLPNPGREVGVLLDASAQHAGRTGREILTVAQRTMGLPAERVGEMLDVVSLTADEAGRRVRDYSPGVREGPGPATGRPAVCAIPPSGCGSAWASRLRCSALRRR